MSDLIPPGGTPIDPSFAWAAITKSDTISISYNGKPATTKGIYVGTTGNITAIDVNGNAVLFKNCVQGTVVPIQTVRVNSTGTSAADLVALL